MWFVVYAMWLVLSCLVEFYVVVCYVGGGSRTFFFFQAEDGIRDLVRSRGLGDVYKRQSWLQA